jgi:Nucleotide-diphospho-sugar transferase
MIWLKIVSIWMGVRLGFDVLFQDTDLVWLKDPWPVFSDPEVDAYLSDDGSRAERFAPLYANGGFFYLRSNQRVISFMHSIFLSYDTILVSCCSVR